MKLVLSTVLAIVALAFAAQATIDPATYAPARGHLKSYVMIDVQQYVANDEGGCATLAASDPAAGSECLGRVIAQACQMAQGLVDQRTGSVAKEGAIVPVVAVRQFEFAPPDSDVYKYHWAAKPANDAAQAITSACYFRAARRPDLISLWEPAGTYAGASAATLDHTSLGCPGDSASHDASRNAGNTLGTCGLGTVGLCPADGNGQRMPCFDDSHCGGAVDSCELVPFDHDWIRTGGTEIRDELAPLWNLPGGWTDIDAGGNMHKQFLCKAPFTISGDGNCTASPPAWSLGAILPANEWPIPYTASDGNNLEFTQLNISSVVIDPVNNPLLRDWLISAEFWRMRDAGAVVGDGRGWLASFGDYKMEMHPHFVKATDKFQPTFPRCYHPDSPHFASHAAKKAGNRIADFFSNKNGTEPIPGREGLPDCNSGSNAGFLVSPGWADGEWEATVRDFGTRLLRAIKNPDSPFPNAGIDASEISKNHYRGVDFAGVCGHTPGLCGDRRVVATSRVTSTTTLASMANFVASRKRPAQPAGGGTLVPEFSLTVTDVEEAATVGDPAVVVEGEVANVGDAGSTTDWSLLEVSPQSCGAPGGAWLDASGSGTGLGVGDPPETYTITLDPTGCDAGTYTASVLVQGTGGVLAQLITVTFTVSEGAALEEAFAILGQSNQGLGNVAPFVVPDNTTGEGETFNAASDSTAGSGSYNFPPAGGDPVTAWLMQWNRARDPIAFRNYCSSWPTCNFYSPWPRFVKVLRAAPLSYPKVWLVPAYVPGSSLSSSGGQHGPKAWKCNASPAPTDYGEEGWAWERYVDIVAAAEASKPIDVTWVSWNQGGADWDWAVSSTEQTQREGDLAELFDCLDARGEKVMVTRGNRRIPGVATDAARERIFQADLNVIASHANAYLGPPTWSFRTDNDGSNPHIAHNGLNQHGAQLARYLHANRIGNDIPRVSIPTNEWPNGTALTCTGGVPCSIAANVTDPDSQHSFVWKALKPIPLLDSSDYQGCLGIDEGPPNHACSDPSAGVFASNTSTSTTWTPPNVDCTPAQASCIYYLQAEVTDTVTGTIDYATMRVNVDYNPPDTDCTDGVDNDGDGAIDLADGGCNDAADESEIGGWATNEPVGMTPVGTWSTAPTLCEPEDNGINCDDDEGRIQHVATVADPEAPGADTDVVRIEFPGIGTESPEWYGGGAPLIFTPLDVPDGGSRFYLRALMKWGDGAVDWTNSCNAGTKFGFVRMASGSDTNHYIDGLGGTPGCHNANVPIGALTLAGDGSGPGTVTSNNAAYFAEVEIGDQILLQNVGDSHLNPIQDYWYGHVTGKPSSTVIEVTPFLNCGSGYPCASIVNFGPNPRGAAVHSTPTDPAEEAAFNYQGGAGFQGAGTGPNAQFGVFPTAQWLQLEVLMEHGTPGVADGVLTAWLNGVQVYHATDRTYLAAGKPTGFTGFEVRPTYGGGLFSPPVTQYLYLDEIYISTGN